MAELPLSVNDYKNSVSLSAFIARIKEDIIVLPSVTDAVFKPVIKGYEVSFKEKGNYYKLEFKISKRLFSKNKLAVRMYDNDGLIKAFKAVDADDGTKKIKSILIK